MIIRVQVTNHNGGPPSQPLFAEFDELGGNIGRADGNALVLRDPMRVISRIHASVEFRAGNYFIRDLGTAIPVYVNGQPLGNGRDVAIAMGDEIRIGGYTMDVSSAEELASTSGSSNPLATPKDDPLVLFGDQPDKTFFDDLLAPPSESQPQNLSSLKVKDANSMPFGDLYAARSAPVSAGIIPPDFDPFAEIASPTPQQGWSPSHAHIRTQNDVAGFGFELSASSHSINDLFDLDAEGSSDPFAPGTPLAPPMNATNGASVDPLIALGYVPEKQQSHGHAQRDDTPSLHEPFRPPEAKPDPDMRPAVPIASPDDSASSSGPYGMLLSWEKRESVQNSEMTRVIVPSPVHERGMAGGRLGDQQTFDQKKMVPMSDKGPVTSGAPTTGRAEVPVDTSHAQNIANHDELLRAFLDGAGVPDLAMRTELNLQFMHILGQLLRESTQGTLDLLLARTLTKREVRADATVIVPKENNPLKFSPSVEVALAHLLAPQGRGFMTPLQAMRDAHEDLRAHQFGFMAGMRAALAEVLERFNPEELEQRLTQKTVMDALLPGNRKAKLWDLFAERYKDISRDAEEDFHVLFGKEFLRAYEAQIAKLEQDDKNVKP